MILFENRVLYLFAIQFILLSRKYALDNVYQLELIFPY